MFVKSILALFFLDKNNIAVPQSAIHSLVIPLKRSKFEASLIHAMDFASVELFSVTYLGLHLVRKCENQQTSKQTVKPLPRRQRFTHHTIMIT